MGRIHGGLVSITFRDLKPAQVIELVVQSGLQGIEWGGDIHVPHGDTTVAERVGEKTREAGLQVVAYGSYYRAGESEKTGLKFSDVCDTAKALGTKVIRVWAGARSSADADNEYRAKVRADLLRISDWAGKHDMAIQMEYHGGTLTDTNQAALQLQKSVVHPNLYFGWQPPNGESLQYCLRGLRSIKQRLCNLHVFHWIYREGKRIRCPLAEGADRWPVYLREAADAPGERYALIEFVAGDTPDQYLADAATLSGWLI